MVLYGLTPNRTPISLPPIPSCRSKISVFVMGNAPDGELHFIQMLPANLRVFVKGDSRPTQRNDWRIVQAGRDHQHAFAFLQIEMPIDHEGLSTFILAVRLFHSNHFLSS